MDIRQLTHFVGVATHGSFSKAARMLHISQPALTRSVQILEGRLGVELFDRTHHGTELTSDGQALYRHASLILNAVRSAELEVSANKDGGFGEVKVGIATLFSNFLVHDAITNMARAHDAFTASIRVGLYEDMATLLQEGFLDLVISTNTEVGRRDTLHFEELCDVSAMLFAGSSNPLVSKAEVSLQDLHAAPWVTLSEHHMETFLTSYFAKEGLAAPRSEVRTSSLNMLRSLLRAQHFIGFLPTHWAAEDVHAGTLAVVDAPGMPIQRTAGILTRKSALLSRGTVYLVEELRQQAARYQSS